MVGGVCWVVIFFFFCILDDGWVMDELYLDEVWWWVVDGDGWMIRVIFFFIFGVLGCDFFGNVVDGWDFSKNVFLGFMWWVVMFD